MLNSIPVILLLLVAQSLPIIGQYVWTGYPACAQPILQYYAPSGCYYAGDVYATNNCLCHDSGFLTAVAVTVHNTCGCADLSATAQVVWTYCQLTQVTPVLSVAQFVSTGDGGESICGGGSSASTPTSSKTTAVAAAASTSSPSSTSGSGNNDGNGSGGGSGNGNGNSGNNDGNTYNYSNKNAAAQTRSPALTMKGNAVVLTVAWLVWLTH